MFKPRKKNLDFDRKLKLKYPDKFVKYLGIQIGESLTQNEHNSDIAIKINRVNAMLYDITEFVKTRVLKLIFHAIFNCQLNYANTVWGQNKNSLNCLILLQKKALRIISFECRNANLNLLFSIGMKLLNYMTKSSLKIVFLSVNILLLIFHQFSIFGLPFPRNLTVMRHPVLLKDS